MRMRTKLSIITAVGVSALLLSVVTASFTFRAQAAYAQEEENVQTGDVHLSLLSHSVSPGGNLFGGYGFTYFPCKDKNGDGQCSYLDTFPSNFIFRVDILGGDFSGNVEGKHPCEGPVFNSTHGQSGTYTSSRTFPALPFRITYQCPPDTYRIVLTLTYTYPDNGHDITLSDTETFQVSVSTPTPTPALTPTRRPLPPPPPPPTATPTATATPTPTTEGGSQDEPLNPAQQPPSEPTATPTATAT